MYVRVYVCVRTWGRSAADTLRHRSSEFAQSGFFSVRDFSSVSAAGFRVLRAASTDTSFTAILDPALMLFAGEPHRILENRCVRFSRTARHFDLPGQIAQKCRSAGAGLGFIADPRSVAELSVTFLSEKDKDALRRTTTWTSSFVLTRPIKPPAQ